MKATNLPAIPTEKGVPVGIWIRVSTDQQAQGESPEHHLARAQHYAASKGWEVREVYDLAGVSGKSVLDHPEAKRMLRDIDRGHIKSLIFSKLARLARNTRELLELAERFRSKGVNLVSLQETLDTSTPSGMLFFTIISAMAEWERAEIADRVKASISIRAKLGKPLSGKTPYGFIWKDQKLLQVPAEAAIRKLMYDLFLKEKRLGAVARLLNEMGHRTRGNSKWTDTSVGRCIGDWTAKGIYRINVLRRVGAWKHEIKDESEWGVVPCEPLISEAMWNEANQMLEERRSSTKKRPGPKPVHLFAGLVVCECGKKMYVGPNTPKYVCTNCRNKIPMVDLEDIFVGEIHDVFSNKTKLNEQISAAGRNLADKEKMLTTHRQEIEQVREEMAKTHRLYLDGHIALADFGGYHKPLTDRLTQLQTELPKLEAELDYLKVRSVSADAVQMEADSLYNNWPQLPAENKRRIIEGIVERIEIKKDRPEIEITFSSTAPSEDMTINQQNLREQRYEPVVKRNRVAVRFAKLPTPAWSELIATHCRFPSSNGATA
jgi:site-specific DNA recombinase